jgi:hypothetical protein
MLATEELFVYVYMLVHDLILAGAIRIPRRPGPAPACTDAELLAIAEIRHLLDQRWEEVATAETSDAPDKLGISGRSRVSRRGHNGTGPRRENARPVRMDWLRGM